MNYQPRSSSPSPNQSPSGPFSQRPFYANSFNQQRFSPDQYITSTPRFVRSPYNRASTPNYSYFSPELSRQYPYSGNSFRGNNRSTELSAGAGSGTGSFNKSSGSAYCSSARKTRVCHAVKHMDYPNYEIREIKDDDANPEKDGYITYPMRVDNLQHTASRIDRFSLDSKKKKLSGSQRRKLRIQEAIAAGEPIRPRKRHSNRKQFRPDDLSANSGNKSQVGKKMVTSGGQQVMWPKRRTPMISTSIQKITSKRDRSWDYTPSPSNTKSVKKPKKTDVSPFLRPSMNTAGVSSNDVDTYSETLSAFKMAVVKKGYPEAKLSEEEAEKVQAAVTAAIWTCEPGTGPQFKNSYCANGAVFITCTNRSSRDWLMKHVPRLVPWEGANLTADAAHNIVRTAKVMVWVPTKLLGITDPEEILKRLKTQNGGLSTDVWNIINTKADAKGLSIVLEVDETSWTTLKAGNLKTYLGLTQLTFKLVGRLSFGHGVAVGSDKPAAQ